MASVARLSKRSIDQLRPSDGEYFVWDAELSGFGVRVQPSGAMSYVAKYRLGRGRTAPTRRVTIAPTTVLTADQARLEARRILGLAAIGEDPAGVRATDREMPTIRALADMFVGEHLKAKRKASTVVWAEDIIRRIIIPQIGATKLDKVSTTQVAQLHLKHSGTPSQANRTLAVLSSMFGFAARRGIIPNGFNPTRGIERYRERSRERYLTVDELKRLGDALREAETVGIPWREVDPNHPKAKHVPKTDELRRTRLAPDVAAALRLLMFTGARVGEVLGLRWEYIDEERGIAFLPDSKTGRKPIILSEPALECLRGLERRGNYVVSGDSRDGRRHDLKRPWAMICRHAGISEVRLHDLRHTFASFGAGTGLGLPVIGRLLGHNDVSTTQRYAHLDAAPLKRAADDISSRIADALNAKTK